MIVTSFTGSDFLTGEIDLSFIGSDCSPKSPAAASSRTEFTEVASELDFSLLAEFRTGRSSAAEVSSKLAVEAFVLVVSECSTKLAVSPASVALDALLFELAFETVDAFEAALDFELTEVIELSEAVLLRLEAAEIVLSSSEE